jgi:hypothetical protein
MRGAKGDAGAPGAPGQNLHVLDANNQDLGIFLYTAGGGYEVYLPSSHIITFINTQDAEQTAVVTGTFGSVLYTTSDCTGTGYAEQSDLNQLTEVARLPGGIHYFTPLALPRSTQTIVSFSDGTGNCRLENAPNDESVFSLKEITLPFTEPLTWPLRIVEQ